MCMPKHSEQPTIILASASPRRKQLLALLGLPFIVRPTNVDEVNLVAETPAAMATRLSRAKARAALTDIQSGLIVAADTLVSLDGQVLGKPANADEAIDMLRRLRGRSHHVFSGVTVLVAHSGQEHTILTETTVWVRNYSDAEIAAYVASGDPLDKAGAYAIQYRDFAPVSHVTGCYANVMGLPLCHLYCLLQQIGFAPAETPVAACNRFNRRTCDIAPQILQCTNLANQRRYAP